MMLVQFFLIGFEFLILLNIYFLFSFLRYINSFISHSLFFILLQPATLRCAVLTAFTEIVIKVYSGNLPEGSRRKARDKLLLRLQVFFFYYFQAIIFRLFFFILIFRNLIIAVQINNNKRIIQIYYLIY